MSTSRPIDRRTFLTALAASGATVAVVSCSSNSEKTGAEKTATSNGAPASGPTSTQPPKEVAIPTAGLATTPFTLGVASGDPIDTSVILWTRLALDPRADDGSGGLTEPIDLKWEVSSDEGFTRIVGAGIVTAEPKFGHSVHLDATDLASDTWYWYRFSVDSFVSPVGRTRTTPAPTATPKELRIGFASCQDYDGQYSAHRALAADQLDLVFFLGDYIYEYAGSGSGERAVAASECQTLEDYRLRYATYKSDPNLQAAHASCPWITTWDDHEVENNYADLADEGGLPDDQFTKRRAAGYQAYYENLPLRLEPPADENFRIYRSLTYGKLANFMVLDGRQYRDDQACGSSNDALVNATKCKELNDPSRTMLGAEQEAWLADGLRESTSTWNVVAQQTVMSSLVLGDVILNVDQWDGYPAARDRLLGFIDDNDIANVIVLTGDIHAAGAGTLARSMNTQDPGTERTPIAVEFVGTAISSNTLGKTQPSLANVFTPGLLPGIEYLNVTDHGYCRCTITPDTWTTEFIVVDNITSPDAASRVDATLTVAAGTPKVTRS